MSLTKEEIAELIDRVPRGMDVDVFLVDLINLAIEEHTKKLKNEKDNQSLGTRRKKRHLQGEVA